MSSTAPDLSAAEKAALRSSIDHLGRTSEESSPSPATSPLPLLCPAAQDDPALRPWCDMPAIRTEMQRLGSTPLAEQTDAEKEYLRFLRKVECAGLLRRPCPVPAPSALLALVAQFPNFDEPLHFLAEQAALAMLRGEACLQPMPLLLTGPAGIGKTHFANALAEVWGTRTESLSMASQSCGFAISGMDRGWSSARPGLVFNALLQGETLSPIVLLDEIDKVSQDGKSDPLGPLYILLEPCSARHFRDEYAGFGVDASSIFWLATANDTRPIPAPLLSRFTVFEISAPDAGQMAQIAQTLYAQAASGMEGAPSTLPDLWRTHWAGCSAREVRIALQQALGKAALRAVLAGQQAVQLESADLPRRQSKTACRIGF